MITKLSITNFRNFKSLYIKRLSLINTISGANQSGKTSILDYIHKTIETPSTLNDKDRTFTIVNDSHLFCPSPMANKILLIDEIEKGLYYTSYKDILSTILKNAYQNQIQTFITTHSKEILETLLGILKENLKYQEKYYHHILAANIKGKICVYSHNYNESVGIAKGTFDLRGG